ncbi:MAG: phosphoglycolate phosphatase [Oceanospirillaceae bacterium]|nr:phosphoglycolate phosphatase [Oceanospirillaceae bacterium]|tara:strand:- start:2297 stop:2992 length:696 start_codon:yes stop_codon:yes gene_type:complete
MTAVFRAPQAILFDLDGTLADTAPDFFGVVNSLREEDGRSPLPHERIREQVSNGGLALGCLTFEVTPDHPDAQTFRQRLLDRYSELIGTASLVFPGFDTVLDLCATRAIPWGIVTNKPRLYTEMLMPRLGLAPDVLICPDDVSRSKPSPEGLLLAAEKLAVDAAECWYVGDHLRDVEAANNAGMTAIAALFGYIESHDDPHNWPADLWIRTPADLITLLNLSGAPDAAADA